MIDWWRRFSRIESHYHTRVWKLFKKCLKKCTRTASKQLMKWFIGKIELINWARICHFVVIESILEFGCEFVVARLLFCICSFFLLSFSRWSSAFLRWIMMIWIGMFVEKMPMLLHEVDALVLCQTHTRAHTHPVFVCMFCFHRII